MRTFATDYATGTASEKQLLPLFSKFFKTTFAPTGQYNSFDFSSATHQLELKTRTNSRTKFPTTMIPASKVANLNTAKTTIFAFKFTDGLYYIEYNPTLFSTFETNEFQRADRQDHTDRKQPYIYIPVKHLQSISASPEVQGLSLKTDIPPLLVPV